MSTQVIMQQNDHLSKRSSEEPSSCSEDEQKKLENGENGEVRRKRERRSKEDGSQRNYVCGCSKSYLSYAALYTHAKTKHNGIFPEGTTTLHKKKQGRPKKYDSSVDRNMEASRKANFTEDLFNFLDICPNAKKSADQSEQQDFLMAFPDELFNDVTLCEKIKSELKSLKTELLQTEGDDYSQQIDNLISNYANKQQNCNKILSLFLIYISQHVSTDFFKEMVLFIC